MKIADVFAYVYDYEKKGKFRELKYLILRTILVEKLANKKDFGNVIKNHDAIVEQVAKLIKQDDEYVDAALIEIYNYPEVYKKYRDVLNEELQFDEVLPEDDTEDDDTEDDDTDDHEDTEEDDTEDTEEDEANDEDTESEDDDTKDIDDDNIHLIEVDMNESGYKTINKKVNMVMLLSVITTGVAIFNTVAMFFIGRHGDKRIF